MEVDIALAGACRLALNLEVGSVTLDDEERALFLQVLKRCHLLADRELLLGVGEVFGAGSDTHVGDEVLVVARTCVPVE